jgi:hypothetical protein
MDSEAEECADNSDATNEVEATIICELQRDELALIGGGIHSGGLVHIDK